MPKKFSFQPIPLVDLKKDRYYYVKRKNQINYIIRYNSTGEVNSIFPGDLRCSNFYSFSSTAPSAGWGQGLFIAADITLVEEINTTHTVYVEMKDGNTIKFRNFHISPGGIWGEHVYLEGKKWCKNEWSPARIFPSHLISKVLRYRKEGK